MEKGCRKGSVEARKIGPWRSSLGGPNVVPGVVPNPGGVAITGCVRALLKRVSCVRIAPGSPTRTLGISTIPGVFDCFAVSSF